MAEMVAGTLDRTAGDTAWFTEARFGLFLH